MSNFKLKPMTDASWILHSNGIRLAMVSLTDKGYKVIGQLEKKDFADLDEMSKYLKGKIVIEEFEQETEPEANDIDGYPIKHGSYHDVKKEPYPSYSRVQGSSNRFAAGYYGVLFNHGWVYSFCPKTTTLDENEWIGPYRTKLEMQNAITQRKNAPKV